MNLRHAAALALVGWYVIFPPSRAEIDPLCSSPSLSDVQKKLCVSEDGQLVLDAPLSEWKAGSVWRSLAECEAERKRPDDSEAISLLNRVWETLSKETGISRDALEAAYHRSNDASKCIITSDPRVAGIKGPATNGGPADDPRLKQTK
jgi:hypothetical protein